MLLVLPWLTNVLLPVPAAAQVQKAHEMIQSANSRLRRGGTRMDGTLKPTGQPDYRKKAQDKSLNHLYVDPQTTLLLDNDGVFLYLGNVGKLKNGNQFPHGTGLSRTVVSIPATDDVVTGDSFTGDSGYEYCLGTWKRGALHGKAIVKRPDGTYCNTTWRWNSLKSVSDETPSTEEIETLEKAIARLEKLMSML